MRNKKRVNKFLYCTIILLFGSVGVHKFYSGRTTAGILYFAFCRTVIPEVLTIIDFIVAVTKESDDCGYILV